MNKNQELILGIKKKIVIIRQILGIKAYDIKF